MLIPLLIDRRIGKPVISREIHDLFAELVEPVCRLLSGHVREREEHEVRFLRDMASGSRGSQTRSVKPARCGKIDVMGLPADFSDVIAVTVARG